MSVIANKNDKWPSSVEYLDDGPGLHLDDVDNEIVGKCAIPADYRKSFQKKCGIKELTQEIVRKLEDAGVNTMAGTPAKQDENGIWHGLVMVTNVTQEVRPIGRLRNLNVLPEKAISNRREVEYDLIGWLQRPENSNAKYFTITAGKRNNITYDPAKPDCDCLYQRYSKFRDGLNYWAKYICKMFGVEVDFLGFEFPRNGLSQYHLHANIVLRMPYLERDDYNKFMARTESYFGTEPQDEGVIKDPARFARYPFKAETLGRISPEELAWLHHQVQGKKLSQPVGEFKKYRTQLKKKGLKSVLKGGRVYRCSRKSTLFFPHSELIESDVDSSRNGDRNSPTDLKDKKKLASKPRKLSRNILIRRVNPGSFVSPIFEGAVVMFGYDPQATDAKSLSRLAELRKHQDKDCKRWEQRGAPKPYEAKALHDLFTTIPEDDLYDCYRDSDGNRRKLSYREILDKHADQYNEFLVARAEEYNEATVVLYDTTTGNQYEPYSTYDQIEVLEDQDPPPKSSKREIDDALAIFETMEQHAKTSENEATSQGDKNAHPDFLAIFDGEEIETEKFHFRGELVQRDVLEDCLRETP
ncbi:hypothetical protein [Roseovarius sp. MMSF_3281]|uniref:hypothetical protein n=1 Tax=Roseovarius sp. MMSF_3281 TaxID=3046694 RepID=UPI00273DC269|nr:hypothetical protein [Roseovarius sp. MMSF_3281]